MCYVYYVYYVGSTYLHTIFHITVPHGPYVLLRSYDFTFLDSLFTILATNMNTILL